MLTLTRRFMFSASHRLSNPQLDAAANQCAFGICQNLHGHNYKMEVTVSGDLDPATGFFANVMELVAVVDELVVRPCDHACLNDLPLFQGITTTMENLAGRIWTTLAAPLAAKGMRLREIRLGETDDHWVRLSDGS
jgi:6-pyruvoyltetrahydropterin/6-carboxytetrahydropterin synthase